MYLKFSAPLSPTSSPSAKPTNLSFRVPPRSVPPLPPPLVSPDSASHSRTAAGSPSPSFRAEPPPSAPVGQQGGLMRGEPCPVIPLNVALQRCPPTPSRTPEPARPSLVRPPPPGLALLPTPATWGEVTWIPNGVWLVPDTPGFQTEPPIGTPGTRCVVLTLTLIPVTFAGLSRSGGSIGQTSSWGGPLGTWDPCSGPLTLFCQVPR